VRLGLIGAGRWGRNYIRTITELDHVRLARLASRNPESASLVPAGCEISAAWRDVLDPSTIDGVIVATPPSLHAEMARAALDARLPVLVEKPLTLDVGEARALQKLVASRGGFVMVDHTHLFHPAFRKLKQLLPEFGPIRAIRSEAGNYGPFRPDVPVLWDWGAHDVAMCLDLVGVAPVEVQGRRLETRKLGGNRGEIVELNLRFPNLVVAEIRIGNMMSKRRWFMVQFDAAALIYDDLASSKLVLRRGSSPRLPEEGQGEAISITGELPLENVVREFALRIRSGTTDSSCLDFAVGVVEILSRCDWR